jgi:shikimate 5-dehydrogenase/shikimate kinase
MIFVICGARGVGKSALIKRLSAYVGNIDTHFFDLDSEIEFQCNRSIEDIFSNEGESAFRQIEAEVFGQLTKVDTTDLIAIAVGGGFNLRLVPKEAKVIWLQRVTDRDGRIFNDRPRLSPKLSPIEEFKEKYNLRSESYRRESSMDYLAPEGLKKPHLIEKQILLSEVRGAGGFLTLFAREIRPKINWIDWLNERVSWGIEHFELRDDLLSSEDISFFLHQLPHERVLLSFRSKAAIASSTEFLSKNPGLLWDWALELGACTIGVPSIVSLHERLTETSRAELERFESLGSHSKISPLIDDWCELEKLHHWQKQNSKQRSFLPRSKDGDWVWYRLFQKNKQWINFIREGVGSAPDQPSLFQWLNHPQMAESFAAVLGSPVSHSWTPIEHEHFFKQKAWPVYAITCKADVFNVAIKILRELGLQGAAITSPLKEAAGALVNEPAVNTIAIVEDEWVGANTDTVGIGALLKGLEKSKIVVWGGGGILSALRDSGITFSLFGATTGTVKEGEFDPSATTLLWAAPRGDQTVFPDQVPLLNEWTPTQVVDLNYKEDSPGRECAQRLKCKYISGEEMFRVQAQAQREFWQSIFKN